jgi:hypothetical protein
MFKLLVLNILFFITLVGVSKVFLGDSTPKKESTLHWSLRKSPPPFKRPMEVKWEEEEISLKAAAPQRKSGNIKLKDD